MKVQKIEKSCFSRSKQTIEVLRRSGKSRNFKKTILAFKTTNHNNNNNNSVYFTHNFRFL